MKRNGNAQRRRREDRGAEGAESGGVWRGGVPSQPGRGLCPSAEIFFDFGSQYGEFWCFLGGIFLQFSYLFYTQNRCNLVTLPYFFFRFKKDLVHFLAFWHRQKFHAAGQYWSGLQNALHYT